MSFSIDVLTSSDWCSVMSEPRVTTSLWTPSSSETSNRLLASPSSVPDASGTPDVDPDADVWEVPEGLEARRSWTGLLPDPEAVA